MIPHSVDPNSVFAEDWWLDSVAPGRWQYVSAEHKGNHAILPIAWVDDEKKTLGMPPFTQTLGPQINRFDGKYSTALNCEHALLEKLIDNLPPHDAFDQRFHYSQQNWLPYFWRGFQQTTRYTYTLDLDSDEESLWKNLDERCRRNVRKARKRVQIEPGNIDVLINLHKMTFERQHRKPTEQPEILRNIWKQGQERNKAEILVAKTSDGTPCSAAMIAWNSRACYYIAGGSDPQLRDTAANSLVLWSSILEAKNHCKVFDFEGSMLQPIEKFFRGFGARQRGYHRVWKRKSQISRWRRIKNFMVASLAG